MNIVISASMTYIAVLDALKEDDESALREPSRSDGQAMKEANTATSF